MGEEHDTGISLSFNRSIKVEARPERLSADGGALILREIDERLGFTEFLARNLHDPRDEDLITHPLVELLRTRIYLIALGHNDQDDADFLRDDPSLRLAVSERRGQEPLRTGDERDEEDLSPDGLSSQPTQSRLVRSLATDRNRTVLREGLVQSVGAAIRAERGHRFQNATLDVDLFPVKVHGHQAGSKYNGYYHERIYLPLAAMLADTEDLLDLKLHEGTAPPVQEVADFVLPLVEWMEREVCVVADVRGDAGIPGESLLGPLDDRGNGYCFRLSTNDVLERLAEPLIKRPPGRKPNAERLFFHELRYQAGPWSRERRVVLVVKDLPGELFLDSFFLLTNWSEEQMSGEELLEYYRKRGTHEGHLGELKSTMQVALSCAARSKSHYREESPKQPGPGRTDEDVFACNEATLLLYGWGYNLTNRARHLAERALPQKRGSSARPREGGWSLKRVREWLLGVPVRYLLHSRQVVAVITRRAAVFWNAIAPYLDRLPFVTVPDTS